MADTHKPDCPCNNADERGCFLISANTNRCVSCTCGGEGMIYPEPYGLECHDGWKEIIRNTDEKLRFIDPNYKIDQIKEKFGGLRYYYTHSDDTKNWGDLVVQIMDDIVRSAEHQASYTCELCGANKPSDEVKIRVHKYWYFGYCKTCADEYIKKAEERYEKYNMLGEL